MTSLPEKPPVSPSADAQEDNSSTSSPVKRRRTSKSPESSAEEPEPEPEPSQSSRHPSESGEELETNPPLPDEQPPPLPEGPPPTQAQDDGWEAMWDERAQAFYFYNKITQLSQWENPRVPEATPAPRAPVDNGPPGAQVQSLPNKPTAGGYDPAIHGDYDPNADYAKAYELPGPDGSLVTGSEGDPAQAYAATGTFNRFTGKWQKADINPENFNDENKSKRQMNAFFDVDAAANSHDGRSLKAERSGKKLSKAELKAFREKRREKKEEKRRAWLRD